MTGQSAEALEVLVDVGIIHRFRFVLRRWRSRRDLLDGHEAGELDKGVEPEVVELVVDDDDARAAG